MLVLDVKTIGCLSFLVRSEVVAGGWLERRRAWGLVSSPALSMG